jgi:hypothetical protein
LAVDFGREDVFRVQKSNLQMHLTIGWINYWQRPVHSLGTWQIIWPPVSDLCGQGAQMGHTLKLSLVINVGRLFGLSVSYGIGKLL